METYDTDVSGTEALGTIKVKSLIMHNCELGPKAIAALRSSLATRAAVDISENPLMGLDAYGGGTPDHARWEARVRSPSKICDQGLQGS